MYVGKSTNRSGFIKAAFNFIADSITNKFKKSDIGFSEDSYGERVMPVISGIENVEMPQSRKKLHDNSRRFPLRPL